jgi:hypothetical protein
VYQAPARADAANASPSRGTAEQFERFLAAFADGETHKAAAALAGITVRDVAARRDSDEDFAAAYKLARKTRLMALHDAVWQEAIGQKVKDPINGVERVVRNIRMLERLAVTERELEPEKPATAVQINNTTGADPALVTAVQANSERLRQLLRKPATPALPVLEATAVPVDPDSDLLE